MSFVLDEQRSVTSEFPHMNSHQELYRCVIKTRSNNTTSEPLKLSLLNLFGHFEANSPQLGFAESLILSILSAHLLFLIFAVKTLTWNDV
jgi:hypothetical protein